MIYKKINLKEHYKNLKFDAVLTVIVPSNSPEINPERKKPSILIFPGGAYEYCSFREEEPVGLRFVGYGYNVFMINYTCAPNTIFPYPMLEGYAAIDYIRKHADEFNVDKNNLVIMGFSAGGHLAASVACYKDDPQFKEYLGIKDADFEINGVVLGYPVITSDPTFYHDLTIQNVTKADPEKLIPFFSIEKNVTEKYPRTFVYTFDGDGCVPPKNTEVLVEALKNKGVEVECHIYHGAIHGSSLGDRTVYNESFDIGFLEESTEWPLLAMRFIERNGK